MNGLKREDVLRLSSFLAEIDALFVPFRFRQIPDTACAAIMERRSSYRSGRGVAIVLGGAGAERQAGSVSLSRLVDAGFVDHHGSNRRGGSRISITPLGDDWTRATCPVRSVGSAWPALELVATVHELFDGRGNAGFLQERDVLDLRDTTNAKPFLDWEDTCVPLLSRGLLDSETDTDGRIGYQVTAAGRAALATGCPTPLADAPEYDPEIGQHYSDRYLDALHERDSWRPAKPGHCFIPLSSGCWPRMPDRSAFRAALRS